MINRFTAFIRQLILKRHQHKKVQKPLASEVVSSVIRQKNKPHWTAFTVYYSSVVNDQFGLSHFNYEVDGSNYHVLRTGCFPYIKYHCSKRPYQDLDGENTLYTCIKAVNFGIPTLAYGLASFCMQRHSEIVVTPDGTVKVYFWMKEDPNARY